MAPQGVEITVEACWVGQDTVDLTTSYTIYQRPMGKPVTKRVCVRKTEVKEENDCWRAPRPPEPTILP
jgi:hypothetical protein